jgi:hypothetical protein
LPNGGCFAQENVRAEYCLQAQLRFEKQRKETEGNKTRKEITGLRNYLAYIPKRLGYLKAFNLKNSNEWKYYVELYEVIKNWGKSHEIFFKYLIKSIKFDQLKNLYGTSESQVSRMIKKQREKMVDFIKEQETIIRNKYPFEEVTIADI